MHKISRIKIENYRSCKKLEMDLARYTPIVGPNNAGKSNIIRALEWGIKPWSLKLNDFCREAKEAPVQVTMTIEGITQDVLGTLLPKHAKSIEPFLLDETLRLRRVQNTPDISATKIKLEVYDHGAKKYQAAPTGIPEGMKKLFPEPIHVPAMTDSAADVGKNTTSTTIGKLLKLITQEICDKYEDQISQSVQLFNDLLAADSPKRVPELGSLDSETNKALGDYFPGIKARVHVPEPTIALAFKSATMHVQEEGTADTWQDISFLGHGTQRSVQMALIQTLAEKKNPKASGQCNLLLIDEPELYLHPQGIEQVREALLKLTGTDFQIVFSTHSPQMIQADDVPSTLVMHKNDHGSNCRTIAQTVKDVLNDHPAQGEILFSLTGNSQILFCENVLLAEGKTERHLLPYIFRNHHGKSMGAERIGFVTMEGSPNFLGCMKLLKAMDIPTKVLADFDYCKIVYKQKMNPELNADCNQCFKFVDEYRKENKCKAAPAFTHCTLEPGCSGAVESICNTLKDDNIWLWRYGDIESVLGLPDKELSTWISFKREVEEQGLFNCVEYPDELRAFLDWVKPQAALDAPMPSKPQGATDSR